MRLGLAAHQRCHTAKAKICSVLDVLRTIVVPLPLTTGHLGHWLHRGKEQQAREPSTPLHSTQLDYQLESCCRKHKRHKTKDQLRIPMVASEVARCRPPCCYSQWEQCSLARCRPPCYGSLVHAKIARCRPPCCEALFARCRPPSCCSQREQCSSVRGEGRGEEREEGSRESKGERGKSKQERAGRGKKEKNHHLATGS